MSKKGKAKGAKLPKQVAGVKIPKELRRKGDALLAQAASPEGRAAIAKGMSVVAGAAAAMAQAAAAKGGAKTPAAGAASDKPVANPDALGDAIGAGVDALLGRLFQKR